MKARLETMTGGFVQEIDLPRGSRAPDVIVWRTFAFMNRGGNGDVVRYEECYAYFVPVVQGDEPVEAGR